MALRLSEKCGSTVCLVIPNSRPGDGTTGELKELTIYVEKLLMGKINVGKLGTDPWAHHGDREI